MCEHPIIIVAVLAVMLIGFLTIIVSVATPFWQQGNGYDVGLFSMCKDGDCSDLPDMSAGHIFCVVIIFIGLVGCAVGVGLAMFATIQRCRRKKVAGSIPGSVPVITILSASFLFIGGIVYCFGVYDDDKDYSLNFSPWMLFSGLFLLGVGAYVFQWTFGGLVKVNAQETQPTQQQQPPSPRQASSYQNHLGERQKNQPQENSFDNGLNNKKALDASYDPAYQIGYSSPDETKKASRSPGKYKKKKEESKSKMEKIPRDDWSGSLQDYVPPPAVAVSHQGNEGSPQFWHDEDKRPQTSRGRSRSNENDGFRTQMENVPGNNFFHDHHEYVPPPAAEVSNQQNTDSQQFWQDDDKSPEGSPPKHKKKKRKDHNHKDQTEDTSRPLKWSRDLHEYVPPPAVKVSHQANSDSPQYWHDEDGQMHPKIII